MDTGCVRQMVKGERAGMYVCMSLPSDRHQGSPGARDSPMGCASGRGPHRNRDVSA